MKKLVLFFQGGGGKEDYEADEKLVASLRKSLGEDYVVHYPELPNESAPDMGRMKQIGRELSSAGDKIILAGHSFGASMLLKYLSEKKIEKEMQGIFLISTPYWNGDEDWKGPFKLRDNFQDSLPENVPVFLYHCHDDEVVPFDHLLQYAKKLPNATVREIDSGGHQLNNDLTLVAKDIKSIT